MRNPRAARNNRDGAEGREPVQRPAAFTPERIQGDAGTVGDREDDLVQLRVQREQAWEGLRRREPDRINLIEALDALIRKTEADRGKLPQQTPGIYSGFVSATDALTAYLLEHGPTSRLKAMHDVVAGGWALESDDPMGLMRDAMHYQTRRSRNPKLVVLHGDILALAEDSAKRGSKHPA